MEEILRQLILGLFLSGIAGWIFNWFHQTEVFALELTDEDSRIWYIWNYWGILFRWTAWTIAGVINILCLIWAFTPFVTWLLGG